MGLVRLVEVWKELIMFMNVGLRVEKLEVCFVWGWGWDIIEFMFLKMDFLKLGNKLELLLVGGIVGYLFLNKLMLIVLLFNNE